MLTLEENQKVIDFTSQNPTLGSVSDYIVEFNADSEPFEFKSLEEELREDRALIKKWITAIRTFADENGLSNELLYVQEHGREYSSRRVICTARLAERLKEISDVNDVSPAEDFNDLEDDNAVIVLPSEYLANSPQCNLTTGQLLDIAKSIPVKDWKFEYDDRPDRVIDFRVAANLEHELVGDIEFGIERDLISGELKRVQMYYRPKDAKEFLEDVAQDWYGLDKCHHSSDEITALWKKLAVNPEFCADKKEDN